jgi:hypothetical protein
MVKIMGRISETAGATQWGCAAASTVATDKILILLMILKQKHWYVKERTAKFCTTSVTFTHITGMV